MIDSLQSLVDNLSSKHVILTGDVNDQRHKLCDFFVLNNMKQLVQFPTRGKNVLDIFASSQPLRFEHPVLLSPIGRSDHKGIFVKTVANKPVTVTKVKVRSFSPASFAQCYSVLLSIDWNACCLDFDDINEAIDALQFLLLQLYHLFFPEKTVRMRSSDPSWLTPSLKAISDARDRALSRGNYPKYLCLREKFLSEVKKSKMNQFRRMKSSSPADSWKVINAQIKNRHGSSNIDYNKAVELNEDFQSFFSDPDVDSFLEDGPSTPTHIPLIPETKISELIRSSKSNSVGPDGIPGFFYRKFRDVLVAPLTVLFNRCLQSGTFPTTWKLANVLPLPKGNGEFRPISILPFLSKVLERLIRDHLLLPSICSFDSRQFGFIPNSFGGCTNALLSLRLTILQHLSAKSSNSCKILAVDFRKAFDSLSHLSVLNTLVTVFQCNPYIVSMIQSFLKDRFQRVATNGVQASWKAVSSGVPQGSILGPLLFVMYINDLPHLTNTKIIAYADDISLVHLSESSSSSVFQDDIDIFVEWAQNKKLRINEAKTKSLTISGRPTSSSPTHIHVNGTVIEDVPSLKILGMFFSSDNKWDDQFDFLYKKCCRSLSLVRRIRYNCGQGDIVWQAYVGLVFTHISFCWPVICDLKKSHVKKLERLDRVARRWANINFKCDFHQMLDNICTRLIRKVSRFSACHPLSEFFIVRSTDSQIRSRRKLLCFQRRSSVYNNSFIKYSKFS